MVDKIKVNLELPPNGRWLIETRDGEFTITNVNGVHMNCYLDIEQFDQWIDDGKIFQVKSVTSGK